MQALTFLRGLQIISYDIKIVTERLKYALLSISVALKLSEIILLIL